MASAVFAFRRPWLVHQSDYMGVVHPLSDLHHHRAGDRQDSSPFLERVVSNPTNDSGQPYQFESNRDQYCYIFQ
jgi:hypothetical protein